MPTELKLAKANASFWNRGAQLPLGMTVGEIEHSVTATYSFLHSLNTFLISKGYLTLEELFLGNSLSGALSEILVKNISDHSAAVIRNVKVGGHPDLLLRGKYPGNTVLRGEGIEVKSSKQRGGWQGHNPEAGWTLIFRYKLDDDFSKSARLREPIEFVQILAAELAQSDWSFSGRTGASRRTITASITKTGMHKLRSNPIYQNPAYIVAPDRRLLEEYKAISAQS